MKKLCSNLLGCIFAASFVGPGMAQEKAKKEDPAPAVRPVAEKLAEAVFSFLAGGYSKKTTTIEDIKEEYPS